MKGTPAKAFSKKLLPAALALLLALALALPALAAYPERPENQYVLDEAGVLSTATEQTIVQENQELFQETGAQIVVVAVDFLDGVEIDDYAYSLFNLWGIGSQERNNGLLLLLAIGEDNYYAQAGYGVEDYFDGSRLQGMLDEYLEPDFAARDYDAGVQKFFQAALSEMEVYYASYAGQYDQPASPSYEEDYASAPSFSQRVASFFGNLFGRLIAVVVLVLVLLLFFAILRGIFGGGGPRSGGGGGGGGFWSGLFLGNLLGRSRRHYGWRSPPPPPPPGGFGPRPRPPRGGGFGGFGGFRGGGRSGFGGGGFRGGGGFGGGFHGGGGSRGGGAGRR